MTRHSKVFVPVDTYERLPDKSGIYLFKMKQGSGQYKPHSFHYEHQDLHKQLGDNWLEEKENVYVLTEQELKGIATKLLLARDALVANDYNEVYHQLYSIASPNFDKQSDDVWSGIELIAGEEYTQSKTNPQTENK